MTAETARPDPARSVLAFFGAEVQRERERVGWTQAETAKKLHMARPAISYYESARRVPTASVAKALDELFDTGGMFSRLHPLVVAHAYPAWFAPFVELEQSATSIRTWEPLVVPGLLQTEAYARALLSSGRPDSLDDLVAARLSRQEVLQRSTRPHLWCVLSEHALTRGMGGGDVMREQLRRLLMDGSEPRSVVQVVPASVAAHPGLAGAFTVLGVPDSPDLLYVEGFPQGRMSADHGETAEAARAYDLLRASALSPEDSAALITQHMEAL